MAELVSNTMFKFVTWQLFDSTKLVSILFSDKVFSLALRICKNAGQMLPKLLPQWYDILVD